jgi:hypothetical protein
VLTRVRPRAGGATRRGVPHEAASGRRPEDVDEQIASLLESVEVELEKADLRPRTVPPPAVSMPNSARQPVHERATKGTLDRKPPTPERVIPRHRAVVKNRSLDKARGHQRIHRRLFRHQASRELALLVIFAVMFGIGVGFVIPLLLG